MRPSQDVGSGELVIVAAFLLITSRARADRASRDDRGRLAKQIQSPPARLISVRTSPVERKGRTARQAFPTHS